MRSSPQIMRSTRTNCSSSQRRLPSPISCPPPRCIGCRGQRHAWLASVDAVPAAVRTELTRESVAAALRHMVLVGGLHEIGQAFDSADLRWAVMKGPVLASQSYSHVGDRSSGDLDLLVGRRDFPMAMRILEDFGYRHDYHDWSLAESMMAGAVPMTGPLVCVDLHWHLHYAHEDRSQFALDPEAMLDRVRRVVLSGAEVPTLDPTDTVLTLGFHAARSGGGRLVWLKDIERSIEVGGMDADELVRRCERASVWSIGRPDARPRSSGDRCGHRRGGREGTHPTVAPACGSCGRRSGASHPAARSRHSDAVVGAIGAIFALCDGHGDTGARGPGGGSGVVPAAGQRDRRLGREGELPACRVRRATGRSLADVSGVGIQPTSDAIAVPAAGSFRMLRLAIGLVYRSGPWQLTFVAASALLTSVMVAGQLLVGRTLLDLIAEGDSVGAGELAPYLLVLGSLMVVSAVSQAAAAEVRSAARRAGAPSDDGRDSRRRDRGRPRGVRGRGVPRPTAAGEDRCRRAVAAVVFGLVTIVSTLLVTIGVVVVLITVAPVLLPIALIGYLPVAFVNVRNTRARYRIEHELTELHRDRSYLEYLMTERPDAKEVRAYGIAPTLRTWHGDLWDVRMQRLRDLVRRRLALTTVGSLVTTVVLIATLSIALILAGRGSITIGDAAVAIVGLQQLSGRLQAATGSAQRRPRRHDVPPATSTPSAQRCRRSDEARPTTVAADTPVGPDGRPCRLPLSRGVAGRCPRRELRVAARPGHGDRRRQRIGQDDAVEAAV